MAANDIFQFTIVQQLDLVFYSNVFYQKVVDDTGTSDAQTDAWNSFLANVWTVWQGVVSNDAQVECVLARKVDPRTDPAEKIDLTSTGAVVGDSLPANNPLIINHWSLPVGRETRGRWYMTGVDRSWVAEGRIDDGRIDDYDALMSALVNQQDLAGKTYQLTHWSPRLQTFHDLVRCQVNPRLTKLRRRTQPLCSIG